MTSKHYLTLSVLSVLIIGLGITATTVQAATTYTDQTANRWEKAVSLGSCPCSAYLFGQLTKSAAAFYTFDSAGGQNIEVQLSRPTRAAGDFMPRLVLYQPDNISASPALPMIAPPLTVAAIYPAPDSIATRESIIPAWFKVGLNRQIDLPVAGKYYLAVYNAGAGTGKYRLVINSEADQSSLSLWQFPHRWWLTSMWVGPSWTVILWPLIVLVVIYGLLIISHVLPWPWAKKRSTRFVSRWFKKKNPHKA